MSESKSNDLVLVLDSGGTKTAAWLVETADGAPHRILGAGRSSGGNPTSVGFDESIRVISDVIRKARDAAGQPRETVARALLSIAGAFDPVFRSGYVEWGLESGIAEQVAVVPDVLPVLAAGTPKCQGVALICGTGSSAFARSAEGRTCLCGGWGYLLGDEGSGYAIGRAAIRATGEGEELQMPRGSLSKALLAFLKVGTALEAIKAVYRSSDPRTTIASLAPLVMQAAKEGDPQGSAIVAAAAHDLSGLAARAARAVGLAGGSFPLAITGGVIVGSPLLQDQLRAALRNSGLDCKIGVVAEPLEGCVRLAERRFAEVAVDWQ
jgi:N-acetylglucosamine kinase-like BadF-type ATPase